MLKIMMMKKMLKSVMMMKWSHDRSPSLSQQQLINNDKDYKFVEECDEDEVDP